MRNLVILGSTGSIGTQTLDVVSQHAGRFRVLGLACRSDVDKLEQQIRAFAPRYVAVADEGIAWDAPAGVTLLRGQEGVARLAQLADCLVVNALVGIDGMIPTLRAIEAGNDVALANKETLVAGGELVMRSAREKGVQIYPVDSEHSAIWQCMDFGRKDFSEILLTASGGAFRDWSKEQIAEAGVEQALKHPNWSMGVKVTIDSATMMNKGLEIIEAMRLFDCDADRIRVVIHPQSIVHSMIRFADGAVVAQMGAPDMRLPIQLAICHPQRSQNALPQLDFSQLHLDFRAPDLDRFPCLGIAIDCARKGGAYPVVMNAANEILVRYYADGIIKFYDIPYYILRALDELAAHASADTAEQILSLHARTVQFVNRDVGSRT